MLSVTAESCWTLREIFNKCTITFSASTGLENLAQFTLLTEINYSSSVLILIVKSENSDRLSQFFRPRVKIGERWQQCRQQQHR